MYNRKELLEDIIPNLSIEEQKEIHNELYSHFGLLFYVPAEVKEDKIFELAGYIKTEETYWGEQAWYHKDYFHIIRKMFDVVKVKGQPTEDEIISTIINCVHIRGIQLEHYRKSFTEDESGLISSLYKLFNVVQMDGEPLKINE